MLAVAAQFGRLAFLLAVFAAIFSELSAGGHNTLAGRMRALLRFSHEQTLASCRSRAVAERMANGRPEIGLLYTGRRENEWEEPPIFLSSTTPTSILVDFTCGVDTDRGGAAGAHSFE